MKIVADENIVALETFANHGEVVRLPGREITSADVRDADVLLVRTITDVNKALLADSAVRFVGSCTIGTDHLDIAWLEEAGIHWAHAPGCNANAVVDYVLTALYSLDVPLADVCVGVVGCGNVGSRLLQRLQALGVNTLGCDPFLDTYRDNRFEDIVSQCEVICLHTPLTSQGEHPTFHLLNESLLDALMPNAVLINAGRGAVIDNLALLHCLQQRKDIRVVLDVWEEEPQINTTLLKHTAIGTPHIAGYSERGKINATVMVYEQLCEYFSLSSVARSDNNNMVVDLDWNNFGTLRSLLLHAYPLAQDQQLLQQVVQADGAQQGELFDRLRKDYIPRREFGDCRVANVPAAHRAQLRAVGFQLS